MKKIVKEYFLKTQMTDVILVECNAYRSNESKADGEKEMPVAINVDTGIQSTQIGYAKLTVEFGIEGDTDIYVKIAHVGTFESEEPIKEADFIEVLKAIGLRSLWPYSREKIAGITTSMGIPAFVLPTIDIIKSIED